MSLHLPPSVIHEIVRGLHIATVVRYLSRKFLTSSESKRLIPAPEEVGGLVALLYDHLLTLDQEVRLIWQAPGSFVKWVFLANRYLSEVCLLAVANGVYFAFPCIYFPDAEL
jgi:hypothetical protein